MIDIDTLYRILANVARSEAWLSYEDLSKSYEKATGEWYEPHGTWDGPLGELNRNLFELQWPPLSAVVVKKRDGDTREPGARFWGSSPNIPERLRDNDKRAILFGQILNEVHAARWPGEMPLLPPQ